MFDLFDIAERTQNSFDFVAKNGNNIEATFDFVEATFNFVERNVRLVAFDNVASTLLLVWTALKATAIDTAMSSVSTELTWHGARR